MVSIFCLRCCAKVGVSFRPNKAVSEIYLEISTHFSVKKIYRAVGLTGVNFQKKSVIRKKIQQLKLF